MSIISIFTRTPPRLGSGENVVEFDAIFEDRLSQSVEYTSFDIEIGAQPTDHGIIQPVEWVIRGGVSNNPLFPSVTDFAGGFLSTFFDSSVLAAVGGMSAGFLAGSDQSRAGATLDFLFGLMIARQPFDVDTGDRQLAGMVITEVSRIKTPENENGLEFQAALRELGTIATTIGNNQPKAENLPADDPAATQAAGLVDKGEKLAQSVSESVQSGLNRVFGA
jgi:hypothetical protein